MIQYIFTEINEKSKRKTIFLLNFALSWIKIGEKIENNNWKIKGKSQASKIITSLYIQSSKNNLQSLPNVIVF